MPCNSGHFSSATDIASKCLVGFSFLKIIAKFVYKVIKHI